MAKYFTIHEFAQMIDKTPQTLRNWDKTGELVPHHKAKNGYRYYTEEQYNDHVGIEKPAKKLVGYCRVSSVKQKDDLQRQVENMQLYLSSKGCPFEIITDIGSGINYNKKGLRQLIDMIVQNEVELITVLYKDRLLRFGFELVEYVASRYGCKIEVVDSTEKTEEQELVEDLVQIITVFSCRLQGKRARKTRKMVEELLADDSNS